ncbi:MAG: nucleotidyltransferase domain-containing protein [Candidatus Bathyarchaeia archaeon]|nr:nucleotidyltransferase domain-containing protein [Candidatus Bathyarchaeota archaeon]
MPEKLDFITPTVSKVLYVFHNDPMQKLHEREVVRRAGVSKGSANSILRELTQKGILEREKVGGMVFYRLNNRNPIAKQFKVLFNIYSLQKLVDEVRSYCRRIILFGSCAEGLDTKESDIDLLILTQEKEEVIKKINVYQKELDRRISPIILNANEFTKLKMEDKPLYERIEKGIILWDSE